MSFPTVVCVAGLKGGTGKTTTAVLLAATLHRQGHRVMVIDSDPQRSATHWRAASAIDGEATADLPLVAAVEAPAILPTVRDLSTTYGFIIIDTPARLSTETRLALAATGHFNGLAIAPISASGVDLRATSKTAQLIREAQGFRPELRAVVLRNRWLARLRIASDVEASLSALQLPVLTATLAQRTAYAEAVSHGTAIEDTTDGKAKTELRNLANELLTLMGVEAA